MPETPRPFREAWRERLRGARDIAAITYRADRVALFTTWTTGIAQAMAWPLMALPIKYVTDGITARSSDTVVFGIGIYVFLQILGAVIGFVNFPQRMRLMERASHAVDQELMDLASAAAGLEHFERPEYADRVELLRGARRALGQLTDSVLWNVASLVQLGTTIALLARAHPALSLLPLFAVPALVGAQRMAWRAQKLQEDLAERGRTRVHLFKTALSPAAGKELRVFGLRDTFVRKYDELWWSIERDTVRVMSRYHARNALGWLFFALGYIGAIVLVTRDAVEGRATPGDVVMAIMLASQVRQQMGQFHGMIGWATQVLIHAERFGWLKAHAAGAAAASRAKDPRPVPERLADGIRLERVTFRYPGSDVDILRDVSIHLPAGATVAVVGDNGAGKSTLVKLLTRFYDPAGGRITVDGVDLRDFEVDEWRARLSAGFQDFARFELQVREVVGVGDLLQLDDEGAVADALDRASAADVPDDLPAGLETLVGKSFEGGLELSGGQWQKLALGRAMMRPHPLLLLLDEPTAALDAPTEHALFERYAGAARRASGETGAITLLVSHRFSTVRMADLILVVDGAGIRESGSHAELMALDGLYAELYELQARAYR
ncbi:MAG TPA: ABC transporter ATP-binding protein [Acidimicrobiales bacterium]